MTLRSVFRPALAALATLAAGCASHEPDPAELARAATGDPPRGMFLHGQVRAQRPVRVAVAPPGAHLQYFGGRILSNVEVVQVIYGAGSYLPEVTSSAAPNLATFYQSVLNSAYVDWLTEYNTVGLPAPTSDQTLGRGSFRAQVTITPSASNDGVVIDDRQIQAELTAQIQAGTVPPPSHDAAGNNNTYYAVFFPHGKTLTLGNAVSCQIFCAYHGTVADAGGLGEIAYGVHPDLQPGSGCELGCGAAATPFGNYTQVASHELVEAMTDPEVGLAPVFGPPLAWADLVFSEIGDICNNQNAQVIGADGVAYDVQTEFSNALGDCIVTNPLATPLIVTTPAETCHGASAIATVTVLGGAGRFTSDVTLGLSAVSPAPPPGGDITAMFDPDPVPAPPDAGASSTMRIATAAATPPGVYTLSVTAASRELTRVTTAPLVVRAELPGGPTLLAPADTADGVARTATFVWSAVDQASRYLVDVFTTTDCTGAPLAAFTTGATTFTVPPAQALPTFQRLSWRVSAENACGVAASSACSQLRTASCSEPRDQIANGGFEADLASWSVDLGVPPPVVTAARPHTGNTAVLLGTVSGASEPLGDAEISQIVTLSPGSSPELTFWEWPLTTDSAVFDQQYVRVTPLDPPGVPVVVMSEARDDQAYVLRAFDLSQFAGMTVKLTFGVHQDGFGDVTGMFIDDVRVTAQTCGPPEFAIRVAPPEPAEVCAGGALTFGVAVDSVNGANFTSPVTLGAAQLPPGATARFADNPISPGEATTMTLVTARPTPGSQFTIDVTGVAVQPPPAGIQTLRAPVLIDPGPPSAPELTSPRIGAVNVPRRPTLAWTSPFVPETERAATPRAALLPWQLAATQAPGAAPAARVTPASAPAARAIRPFAFGAASYQLQIARDAAFTQLVIDTAVATTSFTVPAELDIATRYFWRVSASNACGTSAVSATGTFIVGACFESWSPAAEIPIAGGPSQASVVASPFTGKIYVFGGGLGAGPAIRIDETWALDPATETWTRKADVPPPGAGSTFGAAVELGGAIYLFGGVIGPPAPVAIHRALWRYDVIHDRWSRGADLPSDNFGSAVAAIDGKIYLAYGSGFVTQTWLYDPVADTYTRKADAPVIPATLRVHAVALGGEMHVFAGGFEGSAHVIYDPARDAWRAGPAMPFTATDPAVGVLGGKAFVVGGRPVAHAQLFDPVTGSWSQAEPITGARVGVDNTGGAALGPTFHLIGGFDGVDGLSTHWQFHACDLGGLASATLLPFVVDGDGGKPGVGNERTAVLIDNSISGAAMAVSGFLYGATGELLGSGTFQVAAGELRTISDVMRALTGAPGVQNAIGSVALFGTEVFHAMASVVHNASSDPSYVEGQAIGGRPAGVVPTIGWPGYTTQAVFTSASTTTSVLQLLAYPPAGGDTPIAGTVAFIPPHGCASFADVVGLLGLPQGFSGQLTWSATQPVAAMVRDVTANRIFSGVDPGRGAGDARSTAYVSYVEDSDAFSTALEITNLGASTANVTVRFVDVGDPTGAASGARSARDLPVAVHGAAPLADVVRWARRDGAARPSGRRGFVVVTTPQAVIAQARLIDRASGDPTIADGAALTTGFSPLLIRIEALPLAPAASALNQSRFAVSNPGAAPATVQLTAVNASGAVAGAPLRLVLAPDGQFFTDNLGAAMRLPPVFLGWVSVQATAPVLVYNHRRTDTGGGAVPVRSR